VIDEQDHGMTNRLHRAPFDWRAPAKSAIAMLSSLGSTKSQILAGVALIVVSFLVSLAAIEYFQPAWQAMGANRILTFGNASASPRPSGEGAKFQFPGDGYVQIEGTKSLQCLKFKCRFSLTVIFQPTFANPQLIIGQSVAGESGWHLLFNGARLLLQTEGGDEMSVAFSPSPGQRYRLAMVRGDQIVELSIDDIVVARSYVVPFTDIARDLTVGGRAGSSRLAMTGTVEDLQIARQRL
jgi:hypothetical protein